MICSSLNRFFMSNLRQLRNWTPNQPATQNRADVAGLGMMRERCIGGAPGATIREISFSWQSSYAD